MNFVEQDCTFQHEGQQFTNGGAWLADCSDGYRRGVVYAKPDGKRGMYGYEMMNSGIVTDWHGNLIAKATFGQVYRGGFGAKMRSVYFVLDGIAYAGRYGCDWADAVRVRSTRITT